MTRENNKRTIMVFAFCLLLIPFLGIAGIKNSVGDFIYQTWQIVAMVILGLIVIVKRKDIRANWAIILYFVYQSIVALSSIANHGVSFGLLASIVALVMVFILLQTELHYEMTCAVAVVLVLAMLINAITMVGNLNLQNATFFIGGKNTLSLLLIPGAFIVLLNSYESRGKINTSSIFTVLFCLLTVFIGSSGTGIIVAASTVLFLIISIKHNVRKGLFLGIILAIYAVFILFPEDFLVTEYWFRFTDFLGKDYSLTSRTHIWTLAEDIIRDNILFGAGRGTEITYLSVSGEWNTVYEAHNFVLEILMQGGVIALALFGTLFFKAVKNLNMSKRNHSLIFIALCVILINGLTESTVNNFFVVAILAIACRYADEEITQGKING